MVVCPNYTETNLFAAEKNVGGARRPGGHYQSADTVAACITKAIEKGRDDLVLTLEGKLLNLMRSIWPGLVDLVFSWMAVRLQEDYRHA
jgi:short-subunit dehydrogenase